jgi:hypothetical protein
MLFISRDGCRPAKKSKGLKYFDEKVRILALLRFVRF